MSSALDKRIDGLRLKREYIRFRDNDALARWIDGLEGVASEVIGASRDGQVLYGLMVGRGPKHVSVIGGSHADEPIGPLTAQLLPVLLQDSFSDLLDAYTFYIVPQMNPDGADRNRIWFADPPDFAQYVMSTIRELPGDDIEFGFGEGGRPENDAAMAFLRKGAPYTAHFSLHGMGFAEGAWFLVCKEWAARAADYLDGLEGFVRRMQFPLHDVERHGEKGFNRIRPGFCTTPTSTAMRAFFLEQDDSAMVDKFRPSSMEFVQSLGGDPLCVVTEMPLFGIGKRGDSLDDTTSSRFRDELHTVRAMDPDKRDDALLDLSFCYEVGPVSVQFQVRAQVAAIVYALDFLA